MAKIDTKEATPNLSAGNTSSSSIFNQPIVLLITSILLLSISSWWAFKQSPQADVYAPPTLQNKLLYPIETNAFQRLPKISSDLNDIFTLKNSKKVWAVGDKGLIMHSDDGGISWQKQEFPKENAERIKPVEKQSLLDVLINNAHAMDGASTNNTSTSSNQSNTKMRALPSYKVPEQVNTITEKIKDVPVLKTQSTVVKKKIENNINIPKQVKKTPVLNTNKTVEKKKVEAKVVKPETKIELIPKLRSIIFIDEQNGWAVGKNGTILNTQNGGKSWNKQASGSSESLNAVYFVDQFHGWVVSDKGTILHTQNGGRGKGWIKQKSNSLETLTAVHFINQSLGWATGNNGTILKTLNGGTNWFKQASGTSEWLYDLQFYNQLHGWIVGSSGTILKTQDGGKSWVKQKTNVLDWLFHVHFTDQLNGWASGDQGTLLNTQDGGKSWVKQTSGSSHSLLAVTFSDQFHGWAVGRQGTILYSQNGGSSWLKQTSATSRQLSAVHFIDQHHGWAVSGQGTILNTQEGGNSWLKQKTDTLDWLNDIYFSNALNGWAVGDFSTILTTSDGGINWQKQTTSSSAWLKSVYFTDPSHGWVVGGQGTILYTQNAGIDWLKQKTGTSRQLDAVHFVDRLHGWAVGAFGTILNTKNGGVSWQKQTSAYSKSLSSVYFINPLHGWVVGSQGTILATLDGGKNWQIQTSNTTSWLNAIHFSDQLHGRAVGREGTILNTQDGGKHWTEQTSGSSELLSDIHFPDKLHGWAVGYNNTMIKTEDGGKNWSSITYKKQPAAWYYCLCVFALYLGYRAFKTPQLSSSNQETITDLLASDRPLQSGDPDPLGFNDIAQGLSRFLRNPRTEPPLTLAITGAWGSGKSSLMNLLFDDLKQQGFSTVWFNAWHHQKSEQLLASLFANIRSQAIPGWFEFNHFCPTGLIFRFRLLKQRSSQHFLLLMLIILVFSAIAAFIFSGNGQIEEIKIYIDNQLSNLSNQLIVITKIFTSITAFTALLFGLSKTMQSFALNPLKLMTVNPGTGQKLTSADPGARYQFAREFKNVTASLDLGRMIIFIDDLDRCGKDNVLELLEAINFLVSSGDCYIILGMAPEWVKICVGLGFKELAEESYAELNNGQKTDPAEHRRHFATQYLEKMINIEIPVPVLDKEKAQLLTMPEKPQVMLSAYDTIYYKFLQFCNQNKSWIALLVFSLCGIFIGKEYLKLPEPVPKPSPQILAEWSATDLSLLTKFEDKPLVNALQSKRTEVMDKEFQWSLAANAKALNEGLVIQSLANGKIDLILKQVDKKVSDVNTSPKSTNNTKNQSISHPKLMPKNDNSIDFVDGADNTAIWPQYIPVIASIVLLLTGVGLLFRKPDRVVEDSKSFRNAMQLWQPYLFLSKQSPRTIKRFLNHLRYMAMRYRPDDTPISTWQKMRGNSTEKAVSSEQFSEPALVALSTLHYIHESWVVDPGKFALVNQLNFAELVKDLSFDTESKDPQAQLIKELTATVQTHKAMFTVEALASDSQREMFLNAQGI